ncbi:tol-pal system protein YbgF [Pelagibius litoralis]|uniref:Cell division coordinator CpoB n=1 Tax=Pelagibius litoralis TaxID=374515 RepID=A0A967EZS7_9PROT|nr:tol-pal system protein YbgF [Pelagibius litoralis]NIA70488.1 tol-pal system protein YbgF [Pelagibius litoralis]
MITANPLVPKTDLRPATRSWIGRILATVLLCGLGLQPAAAQSVDDRIERLQRELSDLQRQVYGGDAGAAAASSGGSAGLSSTQAARIELRLNQFESELRTLTGQVEEMRFETESVSSRMDRLVADVDLRLQQLEQGGVAGGPSASLADTGNPGAPAASQGLAQGATQGATQGAPGTASSSATPQTLGRIAETDLQNFKRQQANVPPDASAAAGSPAAAAPVAALPGNTPREQYDHAFGLLRQANYQGAEQALSAFLVQHPDDALAGNAKYWLGETYYVRGDYQSAAVTFAEGFEAYPDNPKAPDNLLKLGMSLASLGSKADACGTFEVLQERYADASATIIQRARQEAQRNGC